MRIEREGDGERDVQTGDKRERWPESELKPNLRERNAAAA
jgi:hypothetical protein